MTKLHHAPVAFGLIVGEWNSRVMKESQRVLFARCEAQEEIVSGSANCVCAKRGSLLCRAVPHMSRDRVKSSRPCTDYSLRSLGRRQEQPERPIWKRCKSKVAIESRCSFIRCFDNDGEYRQRTGRLDHPTNRVGEQKFTDSLTPNGRIACETPNKGSRNSIVTRQSFRMFGRQVVNGKRKGTQAIETDNPTLIVDSNEDTRDVALFVLPGAKTKPIIERSHAARKRRTVMFAERLDCFDHARSTKQMPVTLQRLDKTLGWIRISVDGYKEGVTIGTR